MTPLLPPPPSSRRPSDHRGVVDGDVTNSQQQQTDNSNSNSNSNNNAIDTRRTSTGNHSNEVLDSSSSPPPPPPPPVSGNIPSPTTTRHNRLRNRHHHPFPSPNRHANRKLGQQHYQQQQQQQKQQQRQQQIYESHSLDDADMAAGHTFPTQSTRNSRINRPTKFSSSLSSLISPSTTNDELLTTSVTTPVTTPVARTQLQLRSRSVGSQTPEKSTYLQRSTDFFQSNTSPYGTRSAPRHQAMERGQLRGFGNSEHDFLLLATSSVVDDDDDYDHDDHDDHDDEDESRSSNASFGRGGVEGERSQMRQSRIRKQHSQGRTIGPNHRGGVPPPPPLEITSTSLPHGRDGSSSSTTGAIGTVAYAGTTGGYPRYGPPGIEGSPSRYADARQLSLHSTDNPPKPPLSPKTNKPQREFVVLGWNLSARTRRSQFLISAGGTFGFSLLYGYLQELISVELCHRKLGLFLALAQFTGYTVLSFFFRKLDGGFGVRGSGACGASGSGSGGSSASAALPSSDGTDASFSRKLRRSKRRGRLRTEVSVASSAERKTVPLELYIGLSALRAIDLGMTNLAMQYVNYPAKTLMKSTRVVFTMIFGVICLKKRYGAADYSIVCLMVAGLVMFMHADAHTSAVFQPVGIIMLIISLLCDGAVSNLSEALMNQYEVGQDEFIFRLYSVATFFICIAAAAKGDLRDGLNYLTQPGTMREMEEGLPPTWTVSGKVSTMVLFSVTGFLGSSCSAAITKSFGALTMSITSTARKATTIFLSFALFPNECTVEHVGGIFLFIASLVAKSLRASKRGGGGRHHYKHPKKVMELGGGGSADVSDGTSAYSPLQLRRKALGDDAV